MMRTLILLGHLGLSLGLVFAALVIRTAVVQAHTPHDDITDLAISPDYAQDQTAFVISRSKLMRSTDGGTTWREIVRGLGDENQQLARVAIAPSNPNVMYLTTRGDGMLKSEDGGTSWFPANRDLTNLNLQEVTVSPGSADTAFTTAVVFGGLFHTTNGGASWSSVDEIWGVTALGFLPGGSRLLVGDAQGRLITSGDAGTTWDPPLVLDQGHAVTAITTSAGPDAGAVVFVATASGRVFRSGDAGRSFAPLGDGLPREEVRSLELSPRYPDDPTVWASTWFSGVFRSSDDGKTWEPLHDGLTADPQADDVGVPRFRAVAAAVDDSGTQSLFVGGYDGLFLYDDHRNEWRPVETLADYIVGLAVSPDFARDQAVVITTYVKGAFLSRDGGRSWTLANQGLAAETGNHFAPLRRLHNVVFSPDFENDATVFSANWTNVLKSTDGGTSWKEIVVSPPPPGQRLRQFVLAVSPSYESDHTVFSATRQGEIFRSEGAGEPGTWTNVGDLGDRVRSLAISPDYAADGVLYAGTVTGVHTSTNGGATWQASGPRMATPIQGRDIDPGALVAISPAYGADGTVFAGTDNGVFVTRDAGRSWTEVTAAPLTASSDIKAVAISPDYRNDWTVLVSTREDGLLRSTDGGTSFRAVGTELFDDNHLVADFSNPTSAPIQFSPTFATDRTIFAYAQTDVLRSTDGGDSWEILRLPSSRDVLESLGLAADVPTATAAADNGRGWFETPVGNLSVRHLLAAGAAGLGSVALLHVLGVGGRRTGRALALHLGGGAAVVVVSLLALAA
jgi:photosystem II stability/assembly factor-like uncharacterized protein